MTTTPTTPDKSAPEKGMPESKSGVTYKECPEKIHLSEFGDSLAWNSGKTPDEWHCTYIRADLAAQETGQQDGDYEGTTPSSQKGGCDYMSFSDAKKLFQKYIDCEMRDPNGLDELAKAMLSYNRAISRLSAEKNYVGEGWKEQPPLPENWAYLRSEVMRYYDRAEQKLNDCVDQKEKGYGEARILQGFLSYVIMHINAHATAPSSPREVVDVEELKREVSAELEQNELDVGRVIDYLHAQGHLASQTSAPDAKKNK